jgi:hypothetical protein
MQLKIDVTKAKMFDALTIEPRREWELDHKFDDIADKWTDEAKDDMKNALEKCKKQASKLKKFSGEIASDMLKENIDDDLICKAEIIKRMATAAETPEELVMATIRALGTYERFTRAVKKSLEMAAKTSGIDGGMTIKGAGIIIGHGGVDDALEAIHAAIKKAKE